MIACICQNASSQRKTVCRSLGPVHLEEQFVQPTLQFLNLRYRTPNLANTSGFFGNLKSAITFAGSHPIQQVPEASTRTPQQRSNVRQRSQLSEEVLHLR